MKQKPDTSNPAGLEAHEAPVSLEPVRRRNSKMDSLLRKINGSTRYGAASLEEQTAKALADVRQRRQSGRR